MGFVPAWVPSGSRITAWPVSGGVASVMSIVPPGCCVADVTLVPGAGSMPAPPTAASIAFEMPSQSASSSQTGLDALVTPAALCNRPATLTVLPFMLVIVYAVASPFRFSDVDAGHGHSGIANLEALGALTRLARVASGVSSMTT